MVRQAGVLRPRALDWAGVLRQYLKLAADRGPVTRVGRGL